MAELDFLKFPVAIIRRSIKDIDSSYRNPWDIYAELAQNAVDAIRRVQFPDGENGIITIEINAINKSIVFEDIYVSCGSCVGGSLWYSLIRKDLCRVYALRGRNS